MVRVPASIDGCPGLVWGRRRLRGPGKLRASPWGPGQESPWLCLESAKICPKKHKIGRILQKSMDLRVHYG